MFSDFVLEYFSFLPVIYSFWTVRYWSSLSLCVCVVFVIKLCVYVFFLLYKNVVSLFMCNVWACVCAYILTLGSFSNKCCCSLHLRYSATVSSYNSYSQSYIPLLRLLFIILYFRIPVFHVTLYTLTSVVNATSATITP